MLRRVMSNFILLLLFPWQVDIEMKSRRPRRKDGLELPAYAAGLANSKVGPTGPGLLEPTQIMTPTIVTSNSSSSNHDAKYALDDMHGSPPRSSS